MANQNFPIEIWNINTHRNRTNNAIQGWNSKLHSIIGKQEPTFFFFFLLVQKLKEEAELASWQLKSKELGNPGQTNDVKEDQRIKRIMEE